MSPIGLIAAVSLAALLGLSAPVQGQTNDGPSSREPAVITVLPGLETPEPYTPGTLVIFFSGGTANVNVATILASAAGSPEVLLNEKHVIAQGETLCLLLLRKGFPAGCDAYGGLMKQLNGNISLDKISIGQTVILPAIHLTRSRSVRTSPEETLKSIEQLLRAWKWFKPFPRTDQDRTRIEFDRYELKLATSSQEQQDSLRKRLVALELDNVSIEAIPFVNSPSRGMSLDDAPVDQRCSNQGLTGPAVDYYRYAFDDDVETRPDQPPAPGKTLIGIFDLPIKVGPNIGNTQAPGTWPCQWTVFDRRNHATHMASIVGSRKNGYGFIGMAPQGVIYDGFYRIPGANAQAPATRDNGKLLQLERLFNKPGSVNNGTISDTMSVFLVASSFYEPSDFVGLTGGVLTSAKSRFVNENSTVATAIQAGGALVIVAAGQDSNNPSGIQLSWSVPLFPQNLGDLPNVLVVTACEKCARRGARLMPDANYDTERRFVHVAAPGGSPLAGWVTSSGIGEMAGTSQAAAYVAGLAAEMIARYPSLYRNAWQVKQRIQVTSSPMRQSDETLMPDAVKLATGLVDPIAATLDPSVDWIRRGAGWERVSVRGWSAPSQTFRKTVERSYNLNEVLGISHAGQSYVIAVEPDEDGSVDAKGSVRNRDAGLLMPSPQQVPMLELCNGTKIRLTDLDAYIPRLDWAAAAAAGFACPAG